MLCSHQGRKASAQNRGFTVVELMVTVTIVVLVTGIVMIRYSSFNSSVLLTSQAYITAFDIREAQSLAVSVRGNANEFREEYGIYITMNTPSQYQLFQDDDALGETTPAQYSPSEAIGSPFRVDSRFSIMNICGSDASTRMCFTDDPETTDEIINFNFSSIAISFKRPDFDASFYNPIRSNLQSVEIHYGNPNTSVRRTVKVYTSGQITVD